MATRVQRAISIIDALLNAPSTADQRTRIANAYSTHLPNTATTNEKAEAFLVSVREMVLNRVKEHEGRIAVATTLDAAAAAVGTDFPEAP